ncbi:hypothetical protein COLO4_34948 [Corchorus olitorius]|uniref:RecQ mediated genome instability protein 1 OB-fold domain-containing protein n=1 Tax=Corchorus olitorius TaxID=93759 RepID=A0A1R3GIS4_9ROSI|nr:hypothetical protein COLO4_34948 [Corchorus olitorius]
MEESQSSASTEAVVETLRARGWCFGDLDQVRAVIVLRTALSDDLDSCSVADSAESELINMDLRSIGGKSLPESNLRKVSHIVGPKVLQISSVRDISRSSIEEFSANSSSLRLLRLRLTDGHSEITAVEYSHVPAIPDNVVPGTKIRLENKAIVHGGILCLNPKVVHLLGGVVQSLYEEWEMNQKYSGFSRSSLRSTQESGTGGPPSFEKLQIEAPSSSRFVQPGKSSYNSESMLKRHGPTAATSARNNDRWSRKNQTVEAKSNNVDNDLRIDSVAEKSEEIPSSSETRPKEVAESVPLQNQAASQKLLQKMSHSNLDDRHSRGRKYRGKGKQEEPAVLTLDEWEKMKAGAKPQIRHELPETSGDEDLAWQLQAQLDLEDYHFCSVFQVKRAFDYFELHLPHPLPISQTFEFSQNLFSAVAEMEKALIQPVIAVLISSLIAIRSYRRKSLDLSGALSGVIVMAIHFAVGYRFGAMLLAFFISSSKLTKVGEEKKRQVDADFKEGGQRNWIQVLFNSGIATVLSVMIWNLTGGEDKCLDSKESVVITALIGGIIGHYSCCNGDTWSSEIGVLSNDQPRLITTFKPVRRGTNGGVTKTGLLAALAAGSVIGLTFVLVGFFTTRCSSGVAMKQLLVIPLSAVAGLLGSIIDSLLGATLQFSGFCTVRNKVVGKPGPTVKKISGLSILDNNAVNLVSVLLTTLLTSMACVYIF